VTPTGCEMKSGDRTATPNANVWAELHTQPSEEGVHLVAQMARWIDKKNPNDRVGLLRAKAEFQYHPSP